MKKLISTLLVYITLVPLVNAQTAKFGFTAGGTLAWQRNENENGVMNTSSTLLGFSVGVVGDIPVGSKFSFQPALSFLQKGQSNSAEEFSASLRLNYLELPLNFIYRAPGTNGHFIVGLGPTLSYGLSGTLSVTDNGVKSSGDVHFGNSQEDYKPFEFGADILAGYEWKSGFFMQAVYNMGFSNLFPSDPQYPNDPEYLKNSYVGLRFGYFLGRH
jgi:Outer membrane protein beta-barrel domain